MISLRCCDGSAAFPEIKLWRSPARLCGLAAAHDKGVLHGDLKPSRVIASARRSANHGLSFAGLAQ